MTDSAREASFVVVGSHAQRLDEELDGFIDAVLVVEAKAAHVQGICVGGVHSQNVTDWKDMKREIWTL